MSQGRRDYCSGDCRTRAVIPGLYQLRIRLERPFTIRVGALGNCRFPAGWYVYTGSARNGLHQRIRRHLRHAKRKHWHIDYLLAVADSVEAFVMPGTGIAECDLHASLKGTATPIRGFGSSDCRCPSHLAWFRGEPGIGGMAWVRFVRLHGFDSPR